METVVRSFEVKAQDAKAEGNTIAGAASVLGVMDRSWAKDVMCPGCFDGALEGFRRNGFVPSGHDWSDFGKIVAAPTLIEQRGNRIYCEAKFHSTQYAQDVKTVCAERIAEGLSIGLSVGFTIAEDGAQWFNSGEDLMAWAKGKGFDMGLFDGEIASYKDDCRAVHTVAELYEYSIVAVPANPRAVADGLKNFFNGRVSLDSRLDAVCAAAGQVTAELDRVKRMREADGRSLSEARKVQAREVAERLLAIIADPVSEPEATDAGEADTLLLQARAALALARTA